MTLTPTDILNLINTHRPVSIIRSGDGEGLVLKSGNSLQAYKQCIESVMKRQMGYEPTLTDVEAIRENLQLAYKGADVVGVPMHSNLNDLGKHWTEVQAVVEPFCTTSKRCSTDVFYDLLYTGELNEFISKQHTINYIGCRDIDEGLRRLGVKLVNSYIIAPEAKFTTGYTGLNHYPEQFNQMEWWMNAAPCEGNVCLVGAGVIGKIYCNWFRDRGGIALDVGAVMDLWAGKATRGPLRGLDAENEKYKL